MMGAWLDLREAMAEVVALGVRFRISGAAVLIDGDLPAELHQRLRIRPDLLREYLGAGEAEREALRFAQQLGVDIRLVADQAAATEALAILECDLVAHGGTLGLDIETAPQPGQGEPRPSVHLNRDGGLSAVQPTIQDRTALDPHRAEIRTLQVYGGGHACYVFRGEALAWLLSFPWLQRQHLVIHNSTFEFSFLHRYTSPPATDAPAPSRVEDTMQACGLLYGVDEGGSGRDLATASQHVLGLTPPKSLQMSDWGAAELSPGQIAYAGVDAILCHRMWPIMQADLQRFDRWQPYELQRRAVAPVAAMQLRGLLLDRDEHARQVGTWKTELADERQRYQDDTKRTAPSTPRQVAEWLESVLPPERLAHWPRTESDRQLSTKNRHLKRLALIPGTTAVLRILALQKLLSSFGPSLAEKINPVTGRIHPSFNIAGSKAGRFTCAHPNLQQLPSQRAPAFRQAIVAAPGSKLIVADWNQVELRAAAWVSGDAALTNIYERGLDLHAEMAAAIAGVPIEQISKKQRQSAKSVSFGAIYGIGPRSLAENAFVNFDVEMSVEEARAALDVFFSRFAVLDRWRRENFDICTAAQQVRIGCGRVVEWAWEPYPLSFPQCSNLPVQGICADAMLRAIIITHARLKKAKLRAELIATVHDELVLEAPEAEAEEAKSILRQAMLDAFTATFPGAPTTNVVAVAIGESWAEAKA